MSRKLSIGLVAVAAIFAGAVLGCREGALQGVEPIESPIPPPKLPTIGANVRDPNIYPLFSDQYAGGGQFDINMFFRVWPDGDSFSIADQRSTGAPLDELNCFRITIAENPNYTATWWGGGFEFKDGQERDMSDYTKLVIHIKVPILSGLTNM